MKKVKTKVSKKRLSLTNYKANMIRYTVQDMFDNDCFNLDTFEKECRKIINLKTF